jgi:hypothetical protein
MVSQEKPFSKRFLQFPVMELPEAFRRRVLFRIYDGFERFHPSTLRVEPAELAAGKILGISKGRTYAGAYLHDLIVRHEGLRDSRELRISRDRWFDQYALACSPNKFLDILDYLFDGWWQGSSDDAGYVNNLFEEYSLPYRIGEDRVEPIHLPSAGAPETLDVETVAMPAQLEPSSPYGNRVLVRKLLGSCTGYVWWLEKHMPRLVLEVLYEAIAADRVKQIRLLSGPRNVTTSCISDLQALAQEWGAKGVEVEWRVLPGERLGQLHDRYILTSGGSYNVPPVNSIFAKAQMAEISASSVKPAEFEALWSEATDIRAGKSDNPKPS